MNRIFFITDNLSLYDLKIVENWLSAYDFKDEYGNKLKYKNIDPFDVAGILPNRYVKIDFKHKRYCCRNNRYGVNDDMIAGYLNVGKPSFSQLYKILKELKDKSSIKNPILKRTGKMDKTQYKVNTILKFNITQEYKDTHKNTLLNTRLATIGVIKSSDNEIRIYVPSVEVSYYFKPDEIENIEILYEPDDEPLDLGNIEESPVTFDGEIFSTEKYIISIDDVKSILECKKLCDYILAKMKGYNWHVKKITVENNGSLTLGCSTFTKEQIKNYKKIIDGES